MTDDASSLPDPNGALLVVGYGNELCGDDAVGPRVAEAIAGWQLESVRALAVHQLTPELAEPIAAARAVLFVDAALVEPERGGRLEPMAPAQARELTGHVADPRSLLAWAKIAFGACPPAWTLTIPVVDLSLGAPLSRQAEQGVAAALDQLKEWLKEREIGAGSERGHCCPPPRGLPTR